MGQKPTYWPLVYLDLSVLNINIVKGIWAKYWEFPGGLVVKNPLANARDARGTGLIPGWGRSPGVGNGKPL